MSVILILAGLFIGSYNFNPSLYDSGPYVMKSHHATLKDCQAVKKKDQICVNNEPAQLYTLKDMPEFSVHKNTTWKPELDWAECDYFAGCYWGDSQ
tara:strand:+ start:539 stop:826 length:288 start_codon:yes stop_codon:yes gene_type:complete